MQTAVDLGVNHWTLRGWYKEDQMTKRSKSSRARTAATPQNESAEQRIARLERENERLRKENDRCGWIGRS